MVQVRRIRRLLGEQMIDAGNDALLALVAAEGKGARPVNGGDRVGSEIIIGVGHEGQRRRPRRFPAPPAHQSCVDGGLAPAGDSRAALLHYPREAALRVRSHISPGPYRSFWELSL